VHGVDNYQLEVDLCARFENGDDVPRTVKNARLDLVRRRYFMRPKRIAQSFYVSFLEKQDRRAMICVFHGADAQLLCIR
jgi:hypothetical protein